jgi:gliding motility-associated-like protein
MKWLLFLFVVSVELSSQPALADTFVVTTTNPTGPGSLGAALLNAAANGDRVTDYINFNITRAGDNIIRVPLGALLPALSSNLIIDGTSQPGTAFGVTNAHIGISLEGFYSGSDILYALDGRGTHDVSIFGLFLKGNVVDRTTLVPPDQLYGILLGGSSNDQIGQPSKGNLISGWTKGIYDISNNRWGASSGINIQSNIFGLDVDGVSTDYQDRTGGKATNINSVVFEKSTNNNIVGGNAPNLGNIFNSSLIDITLQGVLLNDNLVTISNNKFGLDVNGNNIPRASYTAIVVSDINTFPANPFLPATPVITNNYIAGRTREYGIQAMNVQTNFLVSNNILGFEDRSGSPPRDINYGIGVFIRNSAQSMISNNIIRYWQAGAVKLDTTYSITITNNSTYCNQKRAILLNHWNVMNPVQRPFPFAYINTIAGLRSTIAGTSVPRAKVELFYNDPCPNCEGKTYFATVPVDMNGNWQYNGPITGDNIVATATDVGGATSEYSIPAIDTSALNITPVGCLGTKGSICGLKILSGTKWHWEDVYGTTLGVDTCLFNVPAGIYFLKISIGSSCEINFQFIVPDVTPSIDATNVTIDAARCNGSNGKICGLRAKNAASYQWEDEAGKVYANTICFSNAAPGKYRLRVTGLLNCEVVSPFFEVTNVSPRIDSSNIQVIQPSCEKNNGSISGLKLTGNDKSLIGWYDENETLISNTLSLSNAAPGKYRFIVRDTIGGCADSTALYTLAMVPSLHINPVNVHIINALCGNSNGQITGITIMNSQGVVKYQWINAAGAVVGTALDLINVAPGNYYLKVKDASNCDTAKSIIFSILPIGRISIDTSSLIITPTGCTSSTGSIKGLMVTGQTSVEWRNLGTNTIVSTSMDLINAPSGDYQLFAVNSNFGCSAYSSIYRIGTTPPVNVALQSEKVLDASCGLNNGSIELTISNSSSFNFQWLKDSVTSVGSNLTISNLSPATYYCIATDQNGCVQNFYRKKIQALPMPSIDESSVVIRADTCGLQTGAILGLKTIPAQQSFTYTWTDANGVTTGSQLRLQNVKAGTYQLKITDARGCTYTSKAYAVTTLSVQLTSPQYASSTIEIPRYADATLKLLNQRGGTYQLTDASTGNVLQQNNSGNFIIPKVGADMTVRVKFSAGQCSSNETTINIKVFDDTRLTIPNAFSPNNDGINDLFRITVQGYFRLSSLQIFNRYGQLIFETHDLNLAWDGKRNGTDLPTGTYYWVISGRDVHNAQVNRAGSITLIR